MCKTVCGICAVGKKEKRERLRLDTGQYFREIEGNEEVYHISVELSCDILVAAQSMCQVQGSGIANSFGIFN